MSERLTELPKVTSTSDNTIFYGVDQDRPFGNQSLKIEKQDFITDLGIDAVYVNAVTDLETVASANYKTAVVKDTVRGGLFFYDNSASPDSVTASECGVKFPSDGDGAWVRKYDSYLQVDWFGSVKDGSTDDQPAIQNAIDYADSNNISNVFFGAGVYAIASPIKWRQSVNLIGVSATAGTTILCNFSASLIANPPTDIYTGIYSTVLDWSPMLYNTELITQQYIQDIRLDGNDKDVYGFYVNEMYYTSLNRFTVQKCNKSPFTVWRSQFCQHEQISFTDSSGSIRILESAGTYFNGLDIERMILDDAILKIYSSDNGEGINISNLWYEEISGGHSSIECDFITIGQRGTSIYPVQATFSSTGQKRLINILDSGTNATFDGVSISTSQSNRCRIASNLFSSLGGDVKLSVNGDAIDFEIIGVLTPMLVENLTGSGTEKLGIQHFSKDFTVYDKNYVGKKINFIDDNTLNLNSVRIEGNGADRIVENPSGRLRFKAGGANPDTSIQTTRFAIYDSNGSSTAGDWQDGLFRLGGYYMWFDASGNLMRSTSKSLPTSDSDGVVIGTQT